MQRTSCEVFKSIHPQTTNPCSTLFVYTLHKLQSNVYHDELFLVRKKKFVINEKKKKEMKLMNDDYIQMYDR